MTIPVDTLTLLVTTYNRYPRLQRLLRYGASMRTPYAIHVLDSSSEPLASSALRRLLAAPNVRHRTFEPATPPMQKIMEGLKSVSTPYVVLWADDDFLVPRSLARGVDFLEQHQDYSVVHGHSALFTMETTEGQPVPGCMPYWQSAITHDTASQRLREYFGRYGVLNYAVHRTEHLRQHVQLCCQHGFGYDWAELALGGLAVIRGKVKRLDYLYLLKEARQGGPDAWATWLGRTESGRSDGFFDWMTGPTFSQKYEAFQTCLAEVLAHEDGTDVRTAQEVVKEAFWLYLTKILTNKWHQRYGRHRHGGLLRLREAARRVPGLRAAWRRAQSLVPHPPRELSLPALLQASSRYREDFLPIYCAIMAAEEPRQSVPDLDEAVPVEQGTRA